MKRDDGQTDSLSRPDVAASPIASVLLACTILQILVFGIHDTVLAQAADGTIAGVASDITRHKSAPLAGVQVSVGSATIPSVTSDSDGKYTIQNVPPGKYTVTFSKDGYIRDKESATVATGATTNVEGSLTNTGPVSSWNHSCAADIGYRAIVGYEQAAAANSDSSQNLFVNIAGFTQVGSSPFRMTGDARLTGTPQQLTSTVGAFITNGATNVTNTKINDVVRSINFEFGPELCLGYYNTSDSHNYELSLSVKWGGSSPMVPRASDVQVYAVPANQTLPFQSTEPYFAIVPQTYARFLYEIFVGIKLRSFHSGAEKINPSSFEFAVGPDASVTSGKVSTKTPVLKVDIFYPLPISGAASAVYFYGTALLRPGAKQIATNSLILDPAPSTVAATGANVQLVNGTAIDADYYRFGVGVDLTTLINSIKNAGKTPSTGAATTPTGGTSNTGNTAPKSANGGTPNTTPK